MAGQNGTPQDGGKVGAGKAKALRASRAWYEGAVSRVSLYDEVTAKIIVRDALVRAGVDNANLRGAYLLRHSAATNMLRNGATLDAVGAVLRHRSPETTAIYAKVDTVMLGQVVQPWIGGGSC